MRRIAVYHRDACPLDCLLQRLDNILRPVAHRKYPVSTLGFQRHAQALEISHHILRRTPGERTVQELSVCRNVCQQGVPVTVVGEIAPSLSGDAQLASQLFVVFQDHAAFAVCGGGQCRKDTCRTAADT